MEETKWLTKGKIILLVSILLVIVLVVIFNIVHKSNLKKEYIKFQNQLEYAAPNYLLKEKISLYENEWREIDIKDIMSQKLVINKRSSECDGYVIAEAHENLEDDSQIVEEDEEITEENKDTNDIKDETNKTEKKEEVVEKNEKKEKRKVSNNISYKAYISCKKVYKTPGYGTRPTDKKENDEETQTEKDTEKPVIELFGDEKIKITQGDKYEELGAVATDNVDGDITSKIKITGKVDTNKPGEYTIKYTVSDTAKNKATKKRVVKVEAKKEEPKEEPKKPEVEKPTEPTTPTPQPEPTPTPEPTKPSVDTIAPVIIFNDDSLYQTICAGNKVNISANGAYGYVARDNVDGNITGRVKITGDTGIISTPGVYNLYYEVSDNAGNKANATKKFTVNSCSSTIPSTEAKIPISSISVTPSRVNLGINKSTKLAITIYPSNATDSQIMFESINTSIATVSSDGVVTGVSAGTTRIKIYTSNGKTAWCDVTVN